MEVQRSSIGPGGRSDSAASGTKEKAKNGSNVNPNSRNRRCRQNRGPEEEFLPRLVKEFVTEFVGGVRKERRDQHASAVRSRI